MSSILKQFLRSAKHTGAVAASSRYLAQKMVARANLRDAKIIIELGPGTGAITKYILKNKPADARLLTLEINPEFVRELKKKYQGATHFLADFLEMKEILKKEGVIKVDAIISGIPFANFSKAEVGRMLDVVSEIMDKDSRFVLFTYVKSKIKTFFSKFDKVSVDFVAANIPPAYVLTLRKKS